WAGDVELIGGQPLGVFQDFDDLDIVLQAVAEDVGNHGNIELTQYREFLLHEGAHADVFEPDGVQHAGRGLAEARGRSALHRLAGEPLCNKTAQLSEIYEVGEFQAISERAAGREDGIAESEGAHGDAQVDTSGGRGPTGSRRGTHAAAEHSTRAQG